MVPGYLSSLRTEAEGRGMGQVLLVAPFPSRDLGVEENGGMGAINR